MSRPLKHKSSIRERLKLSGDKIRRARLPKKMKIAAKITEALDAQGWGNKNLAHGLNKYASEITKWLKGDHNFTVDTLSDIEEILNIKLFSISEEEENRNVLGVYKLTLDVEYKGDTKDYDKALSEVHKAGGTQITSFKFESIV